MDYDTGMPRVRGFTDKIPYIFFSTAAFFSLLKYSCLITVIRVC